MDRLKRFSDLENLLKVLKYVLDNSVGLGVNLQVATRFYLEHLLHRKDYDRREYNKAYMRLYRFFNALRDLGYVEIRKANSLVWIKAHETAVDLILSARKIQTQLSDRGDRVKPLVYVTRKRVNEYRYSARVFLSTKRSLDKKDYEYVYGLFSEYIEEVSSKVLVFRSPDGEIVLKRYSHRFQRRYLRRAREKFRRIFDNAGKRFSEGVFLTLTMDPRSYSSILEGVRLRSRAWNRFMSFLSKRFGFRPPYIAVLEFMDSGNPHLHVVIFGVGRIMDHYELTEYLKRHGFGQIHYEYKIVNKHGNWVWANPKSSPSKTMISVADYLEKYLEKSFGIHGDHGNANSTDNLDVYKVSLYWGTDARFFTYSRCLYQPVCLSREYGWVFIGSYNVFEAPDWLWDHVLEFIERLGPPPWYY